MCFSNTFANHFLCFWALCLGLLARIRYASTATSSSRCGSCGSSCQPKPLHNLCNGLGGLWEAHLCHLEHNFAHSGLHCGHLSSPVEASKQAKTIAQIVQCSWGSFGSLICAILFWGLVYWYTGSPVHKYTGTSVHRCTFSCKSCDKSLGTRNSSPRWGDMTSHVEVSYFQHRTAIMQKTGIGVRGLLNFCREVYVLPHGCST